MKTPLHLFPSLFVLSSLLVLASCEKKELPSGGDEPDNPAVETRVEYVLAEGVDVCTDNEVQTITSPSTVTTGGSDGSFISRSLLDKPGFGPGRTFILPPCEAYPDGLMGQISNCDPGSGKIYYKKKKLEEVFKSLNLQAGGEIGQYVKEIRDVSGKSVPFYTTKAMGKDDIRINIPETNFRNLDDNIGVKIKGTIDLPMLISIVVEDFTLINSSFKINPTFDVSLDLKAEFGDNIVEKKYPFLTVICGAFIVGPVVVTPLIQLSVYISAEGKLGMTGSVSYKQKSTLQMIYDHNAGFSADAKELGTTTSEPFKLGSSLYIEGNMYAGLDLSAGVGIFGDALYATVGIQEKVKCGGHYEFNLQRYSSNFNRWYAATSSSLFYTDLSTQGVAALNTFGGEYLGNVKSSESTERLDSAFFVPIVKARVVSLNESSAKVEISAKQRTLLPMDIGYRVYKKTPLDPNFDEMTATNFSDGSTYEELSLGEFVLPAGTDSLTYELNFSLGTEDAKYRVCPYICIGGTNYELDKMLYSAFFTSTGKMFKTFEEILREVSKSLVKVPEDWFKPGRSVSDWSDVLITSKNKIPHMTLLCSELSFRGSLDVSDHSAAGKYTWELSGLNGNDLTSVDIQDRNFYDGTFNAANLVSLKITSDAYCRTSVFGGIAADSPLEILELGGKMPEITSLYLSTNNLAKLKEVSLDGLEAIKSVNMGVSRGHDVKLTVRDCPVLTGYTIYDKGTDIMKLINDGPAGQTWYIRTGYDFDSFTIGDKISYIEIADCSFGNLSITSKTASEFKISNCTIDVLDVNGFTGEYLGNYYRNDIQRCTIGSTTVASCPNLEDIGISSHSVLNNYKVGSLSITGCPKLSVIYADDLEMTQFSLDAAGVVKKIYMENNPITAVVPAVFETIWDNGGDIRIDWLWDYEYYTPRMLDHGYYYTDEPDVRHSHSWVRN